MSDLLSRLDAYPDLPAADRAAVERDVAATGDPELEDALRDAQALAALLSAAAPSPALDLPRHLVARRLGYATDDDALREALAGSPELRAEAEQIDARLDALAAEIEDPAAQFERLTGHSLAPARLAADRAARPAERPVRPRPLRWARRLALAAAFAVVGYGGLLAASSLATPEAARVADLEATLDYRTLSLRGEAETADDLGATLADALATLAAARTTTLGLFSSYPDAALARAASEIGAVAERAPEGSSVQQEALMSLARIQIHSERYPEATRTLRRIADAGGYDAPEARRLLDYVTAQRAS